MGVTSRRSRVCIIDDHEVVRSGVRWVLEAAGDFDVVGEASNAREGLRLVFAQNPDIVVIDAKLPGSDGVSLVRSIRSRRPEIACLILTSYPQHDILSAAVMAGAAGFVSKDVEGTTLVAALRKVFSGGSVLDWKDVPGPQVVARPAPAASDIVDDLTPRERRILEFIAEGRTNQEIADRLFLAEKTVRNYVSNLFAKLGVRNRTEAATLLVTSRAEAHPLVASA